MLVLSFPHNQSYIQQVPHINEPRDDIVDSP